MLPPLLVSRPADDGDSEHDCDSLDSGEHPAILANLACPGLKVDADVVGAILQQPLANFAHGLSVRVAIVIQDDDFIPEGLNGFGLLDDCLGGLVEARVVFLDHVEQPGGCT